MSNIGLKLDNYFTSLDKDDKVGRYRCKKCGVEFLQELDSHYASHLCYSKTNDIVIGIGELVAIEDRK